MRKRNVTTEFLKECMADALLQLLREKPLEEITITEITELANVGRVTFYRHFAKKEELIIFKLTTLCDQFFQNFPETKKTNHHYFAQQLFSFIYSIREMLTILYRADLMEIILFPLYKAARQENMNNHTKLFHNSFLIFGIMGIIVEWIQDGFLETPEELLQIMESIDV